MATSNLASRGQGRPDYSQDVWKAQTFKRIQLYENESLKGFMKVFSNIPSAYPFARTPLASVATAHLMDIETGVDMPYTFLAGYELEILMLWISTTQETRNIQDFDGFLSSEFYAPGRQIYYESEVYEFTSKMIDPTFALPHTIDFRLTNLGADVLSGTAYVVCILRAHGTQKSTTKTVKCKWCGTEKQVPLETTKWTCPGCGKETWFMRLMHGVEVKK